MSTLDIVKLNIKINAIKVVSLWLTTGILFFKAGSMYKDFTARMNRYENYETRIDSLEKWKTQVTAYYIPNKK